MEIKNEISELVESLNNKIDMCNVGISVRMSFQRETDELIKSGRGNVGDHFMERYNNSIKDIEDNTRIGVYSDIISNLSSILNTLNKKSENCDSSIIKNGLTDQEVYKIVNEWYTNGMYPDCLQDHNGRDLEEIIESDYLI